MNAPLMRVSWSRDREAALAEAPTGESVPGGALAGRLAHFWLLDAVRPVTLAATRLYCYWLQQFQAAGWPATLPAREPLVAAHLGCATAAVRRARLSLVGRGLLTYELGADGAAPSWGLPAPAGHQPATLPPPAC